MKSSSPKQLYWAFLSFRWIYRY